MNLVGREREHTRVEHARAGPLDERGIRVLPHGRAVHRGGLLFGHHPRLFGRAPRGRALGHEARGEDVALGVLREVGNRRAIFEDHRPEREEVRRCLVGQTELKCALVRTAAIILEVLVEDDARTEAVHHHGRLHARERERVPVADREPGFVGADLGALPRLDLFLLVLFAVFAAFGAASPGFLGVLRGGCGGRGGHGGGCFGGLALVSARLGAAKKEGEEREAEEVSAAHGPSVHLFLDQ